MDTITTATPKQAPPANSLLIPATAWFGTQRGVAQPVPLTQYDDTLPVLAVALYLNGQPYTVPDGAAVNVRMDKRDGHYIYNPAYGLSDDRKIVYVAVTLQMTTGAGEYLPILELVVDGDVAGTSVLPIHIAKNPVPEDAVESTDEYLTLYQILEQAQDAAQIVQQNAQNLQNLTDNLEAVQNAAANAQAAAASAAVAQQAAQEALGFRTFFSAVTPDENGDLDPSRPMTTPTAASVTVKSKGDRIQSVQVNGFTNQAGTGDPSPTNVRAISTAGMRLTEFILDGSGVYSTITINTNTISFFTSPGQINPVINVGYCQALKLVSGNNDDFPHWYPSPDNKYLLFFFPISYFGGKTDKPSIVAALNDNPVKCWYQDAGGSGSLYIPIETQGHEYRCQCLELTAPLCDGDKVESCVPSGCDKTLIIDGSTVAVTASGTDYVVAATDTADDGNVYAEGLAYLSLAAGQIVIPASSFPASVTSAQTANTWLQSNPQKVWYRSTAYTEANDIPVQLETHTQAYLSLSIASMNNSSDSHPGWVVPEIVEILGAGVNKEIAGSKCSVVADGKVSANTNNKLVFFAPKNISNLTQSELKAQYPDLVVQITIPYKTPAIYAHDPVTLVAVPYTQADVDAANQLANTPSTLPAIDSPDVPMLLDSADNTDSTAQVMALAANAVPVVGTYVVSSQDGTTLAVSLKAMQDGGDAATLGGMTTSELEQAVLASLRANIDAATLGGQTASQLRTGIDAATLGGQNAAQIIQSSKPGASTVYASTSTIAAGQYDFTSAITAPCLLSIMVQREGKNITDNVVLFTGDSVSVAVKCSPNDNTGVEMYSNITITSTGVTFGDWYCGFEYQGSLSQSLCTGLTVRALAF